MNIWNLRTLFLPVTLKTCHFCQERHADNPNTWEAETGGSHVPGQIGLHNKTLSQRNKKARQQQQNVTFAEFLCLFRWQSEASKEEPQIK
jgi:hypothetical protein